MLVSDFNIEKGIARYESYQLVYWTEMRVLHPRWDRDKSINCWFLVFICKRNLILYSQPWNLIFKRASLVNFSQVKRIIRAQGITPPEERVVPCLLRTFAAPASLWLGDFCLLWDARVLPWFVVPRTRYVLLESLAALDPDVETWPPFVIISISCVCEPREPVPPIGAASEAVVYFSAVPTATGAFKG